MPLRRILRTMDLIWISHRLRTCCLRGNTTLADRSFGSIAENVSVMVSASVEGLQENGVSACLKHFPGLGSTLEDTGAGMAVCDKTLEDFQTTDFLAFQSGINVGADFVMVSHLSLPNITGDNTPASLSDKMITEILRGQMGFNSVVITDAMNMGSDHGILYGGRGRSEGASGRCRHDSDSRGFPAGAQRRSGGRE